MTSNERDHYQIFARMVVLSWRLERGSIHLRDREGRLLTTLDQVVLAILADELQPAEVANVHPL